MGTKGFDSFTFNTGCFFVSGDLGEDAVDFSNLCGGGGVALVKGEYLLVFGFCLNIFVLGKESLGGSQRRLDLGLTFRFGGSGSFSGKASGFFFCGFTCRFLCCQACCFLFRCDACGFRFCG